MTRSLSIRHGRLPLPLAGEGWGEGDAGTTLSIQHDARTALPDGSNNR